MAVKIACAFKENDSWQYCNACDPEQLGHWREGKCHDAVMIILVVCSGIKRNEDILHLTDMHNTTVTQVLLKIEVSVNNRPIAVRVEVDQPK